MYRLIRHAVMNGYAPEDFHCAPLRSMAGFPEGAPVKGGVEVSLVFGAVATFLHVCLMFCVSFVHIRIRPQSL